MGDRWRAMWQARREANFPWILTWLQHQWRDACWQHGSVCEDFTKIALPVHAVSDWADDCSAAVPRLQADLTCPRRGLIGPWALSFPHDVTVEPAIGWLQEVLRWCDHWLKGRDTGIMEEPLLRAWVRESLPPTGRGRWWRCG